MSTDMTVPQVLRTAAEVVTRNGWYRGWPYDVDQRAGGVPIGDCRVCLMGAVRVAIHGNPLADSDQVQAAFHPLRVRLQSRGDGRWSLSRWNDLVAEDHVEVVGLLMSVADAVEAGEGR